MQIWCKLVLKQYMYSSTKILTFIFLFMYQKSLKPASKTRYVMINNQMNLYIHVGNLIRLLLEKLGLNNGIKALWI